MDVILAEEARESARENLKNMDRFDHVIHVLNEAITRCSNLSELSFVIVLEPKTEVSKYSLGILYLCSKDYWVFVASIFYLSEKGYKITLETINRYKIQW